MNFIKTEIDGVIIVEPKVYEDNRGYFFESYNEAEFNKNGITSRFVQDNQSKSHYGVVRGLHCQTGQYAQAKLVRALQGEVLDVAVDIRPNSNTFGKYVSVVLSDENKRQLFIPRGFLHGLSVLSDTAIFYYKVDNIYCKESEFKIRYDDPDIGVDWKLSPDVINTGINDNVTTGLKDVPNNW